MKNPRMRSQQNEAIRLMGIQNQVTVAEVHRDDVFHRLHIAGNLLVTCLMGVFVFMVQRIALVTIDICASEDEMIKWFKIAMFEAAYLVMWGAHLTGTIFRFFVYI